MSNPNMNPNPQSGGQDDAQTSRYFDNPYGYPYGYPYGPGQPNPNDSNGEWKPVSPFKLMESWLAAAACEERDSRRVRHHRRDRHRTRLGAVYLAGCDA